VGVVKNITRVRLDSHAKKKRNCCVNQAVVFTTTGLQVSNHIINSFTFQVRRKAVQGCELVSGWGWHGGLEKHEM